MLCFLQLVPFGLSCQTKKTQTRGGHLALGGGRTTPRPAGSWSPALPLFLLFQRADPLFFFFFFFLIQGVVEPPPWPKGWPATPCGWIGHPSSFTFFFSLTGGGLATPCGWIGHPSSFTFFFFKKKKLN
jgi:hypothetical protein